MQLERKLKITGEASVDTSMLKAEVVVETDAPIKSNEIKPETSLGDSVSLRLCGYALPRPGKVGIATAHTLREGLMRARDNDKTIMFNPQKQVLVDKIIRKLANIPTSGLDAEEDIPNIFGWAQAIGLSCANETSDIEDPSADLDSGIGLGRTTRNEGVISRRTIVNRKKAMPQVITSVITGEISGDCKRILIKQDDSDGDELTIVCSKKASRVKPRQVFKKNVLEGSQKQAELSQLEILKADSKHPLSPLESGQVNQSARKINHSSLLPLNSSAIPSGQSSLVTKYLNDAKYQNFIDLEYRSSEAFERHINKTVKLIESQTIDSLESWLGERHVSPFVFMQDLTIGEVIDLATDPEIRQMLSENNIKYETFVAWIDLAEDFFLILERNDDMLFGELFIMGMIAIEMQNGKI